jgi:translation initiation factor 1
VRRETAGRAGKTVTTITPLVLSREDAQALLAALKKLCGGGGTLKIAKGSDGKAVFVVELQGDHADKIVADLVARGYRAKRAGG